jgi:hypothetical protein
LAEIYWKRQEWEQALALAEPVDEVARQAFLRAKIYLAKNDIVNALAQARLSFNSARTQHIDWIGLDMALILLELGNVNSENNVSTESIARSESNENSEPAGQQTLQPGDSADMLLYRRYIQNNHSQWWARRNQERLKGAGIELNPYPQDKGL